MLKKLINKYELSSDTRSLKENEIFLIWVVRKIVLDHIFFKR